MKKRLVLYGASAMLGALAAVALYEMPATMPDVAAQEARPWSRSDLPPMPRPSGSAVAADTPPARTDAAPWRTAEPLGLDELTAEERVNVLVYEKANRSAVNINTKTVQTDMFFMRELTSEGEGSGTVLDRGGHILTNFHVIDGAREVRVTLHNGKTYSAQIVGEDPDTDIAVLKIDAPRDELHPVEFGDATRLRVGQRVFAIGNPFGLERTLSTGIIASLNRSLPSRRTHRSIKSIIQIDAAINPGNSGGPLLDSRGRMIGMNTAIASKTGESAGVGFAIPMSTIARVVPQLIRDGRVVRPDIGIARVYQTDNGLLIASLVPDGPADRAGLQGPKVVRRQKRQGPFVYEYQTVDRAAADLIVGVDGQPTQTAEEFLSAIESKQPGDRVTLSIIRDGKEVRVPVTLGSDGE